jgi:hypothetical protein
MNQKRLKAYTVITDINELVFSRLQRSSKNNRRPKGTQQCCFLFLSLQSRASGPKLPEFPVMSKIETLALESRMFFFIRL